MREKLLKALEEYHSGGGNVIAIFGKEKDTECYIQGKGYELLTKAATAIYTNEKVRYLFSAALEAAEEELKLKLDKERKARDLSSKN